MDIIRLIFQYEYMQNAYIIGILIGFLAPILGVYIIIRRLALIVEGISHITLAGISFSMMLGKLGILVFEPLYSGLFFAVTGSIAIEKISNDMKHYKEVAIPIIVSISLSLMVIFASLAGGFNKDILSFLFGNILTTTRTDIYFVLATVIIVIALIKIYYYDILGFAVDDAYAKFAGINIKYYKNVFIVLIGVIIALSIKVVGMMLIGSLVVIPVSSAMKVTDSFKKTVIIAIVFSEISIITGLVLSFYINVPSGGAIVLVNGFIFMMTQMYQKGRSRKLMNM